jgi:hypothetical protein
MKKPGRAPGFFMRAPPMAAIASFHPSAMLKNEHAAHR